MENNFLKFQFQFVETTVGFYGINQFCILWFIWIHFKNRVTWIAVIRFRKRFSSGLLNYKSFSFLLDENIGNLLIYYSEPWSLRNNAIKNEFFSFDSHVSLW